MDGLECSEININDIDKELFRIEAEYYKKVYRYVEEKLSTFDSIGQIKKEIVCGPFGSNLLDSEYKNNGVLVVRPFNLVNCKIENDRLVYISNETVKINGLKLFGKGVTLFSRVGDIKIGYANKSNYTISPNIIAVDFDDEALSKYCAIFFNTKYGKIQIQRQLKIAAQPTISTGIIQDLKMPFFEKLSSIIVKCIIEAESVEKKADALVKKAEYALSNELSINMASNQSISIKMFSDSYKITKRLDAEYYQPKYTSYTDALKTTDTVQTICNLNDKNFIPDENVEYEYIELANVGNTGNISNVEKILGKELPSRARRQVKTGQVIVASVEGSLQSCALITEEYNNALCSTGFYVLESDVLNSETLLVLFKSKPIQALLKQRCSGTILTAITKDELLSMPLPQIDVTLQREIAIKVQESFAQRRKSELLLEYAKQAVEMAIEQGEDVAIKWLNAKNGSCYGQNT